MRRILQRNKRNSEVVAGSTDEEFVAVYRQYSPLPAGLWQKSLLAALRRLKIEPLFSSHLTLRVSDFCRQRNALELANSL